MGIVSLHTLRITVVREASPLTQPLRFPRDAPPVIRRFIPEDDPREHFLALLLDTRHRTLGVQEVSIGSMNGSLVHPKNVFCIAVRELASAIILGHNHPSGDVTPSAEDQDLTRRLVECGRLLGIPVLDHVIVGELGSYFSFKENLLLQ